MKDTFIHCSSNDKIYRDNDFDSVHRTGIEVNTKKGKTEYIANTRVEFKRYKTLRGALNFMQRMEMKPVAIEDNGMIIPLSNSKLKQSKTITSKKSVKGVKAVKTIKKSTKTTTKKK